ncbi:MAG: xanthine dehydrogenase accessory protein XdhC [Leptothrix sp. (in: Bacteria)]|nr:xanthine dehydrogenase accessory protein XdhC [Leptothrix sp. (in: b-proteobacteria)]
MRETALRWQAERRPAVVVEVLHTLGSVPREAGTCMLVAAEEVHGTIGGGHLEWQAIADARALLAQAVPAAARPEQRIALGPSLGQCCGGVLTLRFTALAHSAPASWPVPAPRFHLQLYGAGHVGRAVVGLLAGLPCRVNWVDERESEFPPGPLPPHIERVCVEPVQAEVAAAPAGAFYLVLTHSHALDLALAQAILARGDFGWFGLIGSATKRARFEHRLRERGFDAALVARINCPIGLPGIKGKEPEVIALAVVAQMLQAAGGEPAA